MIIEKVNIKDKFSKFSDYWSPKIVGELNHQHIKLVKFKGPFEWHQHELEDEMFLVIEGSFNMHFSDKVIEVNQGDFIIIPKGTEHKPEAPQEVHVMLFEPATTLNTGDRINAFTKQELEKL